MGKLHHNYAKIQTYGIERGKERKRQFDSSDLIHILKFNFADWLIQEE